VSRSPSQRAPELKFDTVGKAIRDVCCRVERIHAIAEDPPDSSTLPPGNRVRSFEALLPFGGREQSPFRVYGEQLSWPLGGREIKKEEEKKKKKKKKKKRKKKVEDDESAPRLGFCPGPLTLHLNAPMPSPAL
jgi:hypothetical protein